MTRRALRDHLAGAVLGLAVLPFSLLVGRGDDYSIGRLATARAAAATSAAVVPPSGITSSPVPADSGEQALARPRLGAAVQWNLQQVHGPEAWSFGTGSADVLVAIVDSGVDGAHPDLVGELVPGRNLRDGSTSVQDDVGHGTEVAGIIAALGNNDVGVAGLARGVRLMPLKITSPNGSASSAAAADAIRWAAEHGARVVNLSFGTLRDVPALRSAVQEASSQGVLLVAAAGNCGDAATYRIEGCSQQNQAHYPAALPEVVAVGALDAASALATYSNTGPYVRLTAPGGAGGGARAAPNWVLSTTPTRQAVSSGRPGYDYEFGTSIAAPHVTAAAALVWSINPTLSRDQVAQILFDTADDLGPPGRDDQYGYGRVNAARAAQRAAELPGAVQRPAPGA